MKLKLVSVRIEDVERCPLAPVILPDRRGGADPITERTEIGFRYIESQMGIVGVWLTTRIGIERQAEPELPRFQISSISPAGA